MVTSILPAHEGGFIIKGQVALEFIMMAGVAIMIMMLFLIAAGHEISDISTQKGRILLKDVVFRTQQEINLASESLHGYERRFTNPASLDGIPYTLNNTGTELAGAIETFEFLLVVRPVVGSSKPGKNVIMNYNGIVCINDGCSSFDTTAPTIISVSPLNGSSDTQQDDVITAEFDESMNESTLLGAFTVGGVSGTVTYDDTFYMVTFTPDIWLSAGTGYTATITDQVRDKAGNRMNATYQWSFTTGLDTDPPGTVTGLQAISIGSSYIKWSWNNPPEPDFMHVELWIDGAFVTNTSNSSYLATGLSSNSSHEIGLLTTDTSWNTNPTWVNDTANTTADVMLIVDLWDMWDDRPAPVDFTSGLNSSADTFGLGGDDGWDNKSHTYDSGSTYFNNPSISDIVEFDATGGVLEITLGSFGDPAPKGPAYNDPISAAYGVEFTISAQMQTAIDAGGTATLEFDYESEDVTGIEHPFEAVWLKARLWNSSGAYYLGSDLDSDSVASDDNDLNATTDSTLDIYYRLQPNGADASGHFSLNISAYLTSAGQYYLDVGAKLSDWSSSSEYYIGRFDNINVTIS